MGKYQFDTKGKQAVTKFHEKQKSAKPNKKQQQQTDGSVAVRNLLNILIATGKVGKHACGYGAITGMTS